MANGLTVFREPEIMAATVKPLMMTPIVLRARSLNEPGAGIPHAGISEGAVGKPAGPP